MRSQQLRHPRGQAEAPGDEAQCTLRPVPPLLPLPGGPGGAQGGPPPGGGRQLPM